MDNQRKIKDVPPRLFTIFDSYRPPLYLVTFCTLHRIKCLDNVHVHSSFKEYCIEAGKQGKASVGRYVIMPDHVHLFVRISIECKLGIWMRGLKRYISNGVKENGGAEIIWQPGFFDHLLRNSESYSEKANYVLMNPVRAGITEKAEDWPYKGEIMCVYMS
jgi:putative transposase